MTVRSAESGISVRPLDGVGVAVAVLICLVFGFNQVAVKLALPDYPPLIQAAIRALFGGAVVAGIAKARGVSLSPFDGTLSAGLVAGILFAVEFVLIYRGLLWTTASRAVLFLYLAPFFVVIGGRWLVPADRFSAVQWAGLALSFAGMMIAFGVPGPAAGPSQMLGDAMFVGAAILWAATTLIVKASALNRAPPEKTLLYQLAVSFPVSAIGALVFGEQMLPHPSLLATASVIYQSVFVVGVIFIAWFMMIQRYSASRFAAFTFMTPLFGVAGGALVLGERLTFPFMIAVLCVIGGLVLVNRR